MLADNLSLRDLIKSNTLYITVAHVPNASHANTIAYQLISYGTYGRIANAQIIHKTNASQLLIVTFHFHTFPFHIGLAKSIIAVIIVDVIIHNRIVVMFIL